MIRRKSEPKNIEWVKFKSRYGVQDTDKWEKNKKKHTIGKDESTLQVEIKESKIVETRESSKDAAQNRAQERAKTKKPKKKKEEEESSTYRKIT